MGEWLERIGSGSVDEVVYNWTLAVVLAQKKVGE